MKDVLFYPVGCSGSSQYASAILEKAGFPLTDHPSPDVTHLLLDVPSFDSDGKLRDSTDLRVLLRMLPKSMTLIGGNLNPDYLKEYRKLDLLKDPYYLAKNAAITADCALRVASPYLNSTFADTPALILGWGRIGKCLAGRLSSFGCAVTVAARKEADRAMLEALGFRAVDFLQISKVLHQHRILFNTVPDLTRYADTIDQWNKGIAIDLASHPGIPGKNVIPARGLPGKYAPESSGRLIAETILRLVKEETL